MMDWSKYWWSFLFAIGIWRETIRDGRGKYHMQSKVLCEKSNSWLNSYYHGFNSWKAVFLVAYCRNADMDDKQQ